MQRQDFIIDNLKVELDLVEEVEEDINEAKLKGAPLGKTNAKVTAEVA